LNKWRGRKWDFKQLLKLKKERGDHKIAHRTESIEEALIMHTVPGHSEYFFLKCHAVQRCHA
jgi:hypothetical protein